MANSLLSLMKLGIIKISPKAWDAIIPHGPKVTQEFVEYMAAGHVREIAKQISDKTLSKKLLGLSRDMAKSATSSLVSSWEDGDICPPWWPWPCPWPGPWWDELIKISGGSDPIPWSVGSIRQLVFADMLVTISTITTNADYSKALVGAAIGIAKLSNNIAADIEKLGVNPRKG